MKKIMRWFNRIGIDGAIVIILGLVAIGFSIYSFLGGSQINPSLLVGVLSLLLLEVVFRRARPDNTKEELSTVLATQMRKVEQVLQNLDDGNIEADPDKMLLQLLQAYEASRQSINLISWKSLRARLSDRRGRYYGEETLRIVKTLPSVAFRLLVWNQEHLEVIENVASDYDRIPNSEIRFLPFAVGEEAPIMPCVIIDESVVNFGWGYLGRPHMDQLNIRLRQRSAVKAFSEYFEYLWHKSIVLKGQGQKVNRAELTRVKVNLAELPDVQVQTASEEAYQQVIASFESSRESINNISWKNISVREDDTHREAYFARMLEKVRTSPSIKFRRLLWAPEHLDYLQEVGEQYDFPNVEFRYFDLEKNREVPIVPCTVIDDILVDFGWEALGIPEMDAVNITLRHPKAVTAFKNYFAYLWQKSSVLKDRGERLRMDALHELKRNLGTDNL